MEKRYSEKRAGSPLLKDGNHDLKRNASKNVLSRCRLKSVNFFHKLKKQAEPPIFFIAFFETDLGREHLRKV